MGDLSGERVVGKTIAPELRVLYRCDVCHVGDVFDAYMGPPSCTGMTIDTHPKVFMVPLRIFKGE